MATMITSECINCGACEPECPNTAIYQGGVEWDLDGVKHPALTQEIFYIVPEKCTECVGFFDHEACAAVCPVDCCIPNPDIPESEGVLIERAKKLHPDEAFAADFPSRFRTGGAEAPASAPAAAPSAAPVAAPAAAPAASVVAAPAAHAVGGRVERPIAPPRPQLKLVSAPARTAPYAGEMAGPFEEALAQIGGPRGTATGPIKWISALGMPLLGAMPSGQKRRLEAAIGDKRYFTASGSTGLNVLHNMILYPLICIALGVAVLGKDVFSEQMSGLIFLGVAVAGLEAAWRMREGMSGSPAEEITYRASVYGAPLAPIGTALVHLAGGGGEKQQGTVVIDGFNSPEFEEKLERERRYGEVYRLEERQSGYLLTMELPRRVPPSAQKLSQGIPDEMPDYQLDLGIESGFFVVKGKLLDPNLRKVAGVSPAFPPDFTTHVRLGRPIKGFKQRYQDKVLEVALLG
jgi:ferredoxin